MRHSIPLSDVSQRHHLDICRFCKIHCKMQNLYYLRYLTIRSCDNMKQRRRENIYAIVRLTGQIEIHLIFTGLRDTCRKFTLVSRVFVRHWSQAESFVMRMRDGIKDSVFVLYSCLKAPSSPVALTECIGSWDQKDSYIPTRASHQTNIGPNRFQQGNDEFPVYAGLCACESAENDTHRQSSDIPSEFCLLLEANFLQNFPLCI